MNKLRIGLFATLGLAIIIAVVTLDPSPPQISTGSDKFYHIVAFAALALPLSFLQPRLVIPVFACVIAYGGMIEWIQPAFGRQFERADLGANTLGGFIGCLTGCALARLKAHARG